MNNQEAIKYLKDAREDCTSGGDEPYKEAYGMAILALEKQIPKKTIIINEKFSIKNGWNKCPNCEVERGGSHFGYCTECGQKLDWE